MKKLLSANLWEGKVRILSSKEHFRTFSIIAYFTEIKFIPASMWNNFNSSLEVSRSALIPEATALADIFID
jgi:hypothetical protein